MIGLLCFVLAALASPFKSKLRLEAENAVLRHQLNILNRKLHGRVRLTNHDRWFFIQLYRWFPSILKMLMIVRPETLLRWHKVSFRCYWRWKSRRRGGRPQIETDLRALIRRMSIENHFGARHASTATRTSAFGTSRLSCGAEFGRYRGIAGMAGLAAASTRSRMTLTRRWTFCRIFGLDGRESYRELRLKPLCCPHRLSRGIAPHEREYPRRNDRF
jgi:hypothetical protein